MAREDRTSEIPDVDEAGVEDNPSGAIAVTLFLAATITILWLGMYVLNIVRG